MDEEGDHVTSIGGRPKGSKKPNPLNQAKRDREAPRRGERQRGRGQKERGQEVRREAHEQEEEAQHEEVQPQPQSKIPVPFLYFHIL